MNKKFDKFAMAMEVAQKISKFLPETAGKLPQDLSDNIREIVLASMKKMDIVTREEFAIAEQRMAKLERIIEQLENKQSAAD